MDDIDRVLIEALRVDGRASWAELGRLVGLSGPSVTDRVSRLEQKLFLKKIEKLNKRYVRNIMKHIKIQGNNTKVTIR